jgi:hypothetical protein
MKSRRILASHRKWARAIPHFLSWRYHKAKQIFFGENYQ